MESDISFSSSIVHIPKLMTLHVVQSAGTLYLLRPFTSEPQSWYAPTEGECLTITWSLNNVLKTWKTLWPIFMDGV